MLFISVKMFRKTQTVLEVIVTEDSIARNSKRKFNRKNSPSI